MNTFSCGCVCHKPVTPGKISRWSVKTKCAHHDAVISYNNQMYMSDCGCYVSYPLEQNHDWIEYCCSVHEPMHQEYNSLDEARTRELLEVNKRYKILMDPIMTQCPLLDEDPDYY